LSAAYRQILSQLRQHFPQPVSDRVHDAYFVFSILRALDQVDDLKSKIPLLGIRESLDYPKARQASLPRQGSSVEEVTSRLVKVLEGLPIFGHPCTQINVVAPPSIPGIIGHLLPAIYNPNLVSDDTSMGIAEAETAVAAMAARLIGFDAERAAGVFTFGGTGTNLYGVRIGLEKAFPGSMEEGLRSEAVLLASSQSHYSRLNIAGWLGLGERNVIEVPTHLDNDISIAALEERARQALSAGKRIAAFIATMGTTDAFGIDDLEAIVRLRDRLVEEHRLDYRPHVHADAVIGWAWSVFNDYDSDGNPLGFRPRTVRALAGACRRLEALHLADSVGFDFHKTGFVPYVSSLFLARDAADLKLLERGREKMPYLFQTGEKHPGVFTLETTRSGCGILAAYANLLLLGREGLQVLLGHIVEMAELLREHLEGHSSTTVLNGGNFGAVTLFRAYPDGVDTWTVKDRERTDPSFRERLLEHNEYNRRIFHYLHEQAMKGEGVLLSMTECYRKTDYGAPIVALKSYMLSPFIDEEHVELIVKKVLEARERITGS
jgi:glutamate/tyrosine decarboxylase-like PLP-dependent enzyme